MVLSIQLRVNPAATRSRRYDDKLNMIQSTVADILKVRPRTVRIHNPLSALYLILNSPICSQCATAGVTCRYPQMNKR
jgi:hypothetical protein